MLPLQLHQFLLKQPSSAINKLCDYMLRMYNCDCESVDDLEQVIGDNIPADYILEELEEVIG